MYPKDLVVFLEQQIDHGARLAYAVELARRWQAHLIGTFVERPLDFELYAGFQVGPGLTELLENYRNEVAQAASEARGAFESITSQRSFTAEWRVAGTDGDEIVMQARHAALAVLGQPARQRERPSPLSDSQRLLFASGTPCLLVPPGWQGDGTPARRIVVGWNGGREATRAIAAALPLMVDAEAVHVVVVPDAHTAARYGRDPGVDMATHLSRYGMRVVLDICAGKNAGEVLLQQSRALDADLLVMGAMGRPRVEGLLFGDATATVLKQATLPLLLAA